MTNFLISSKSQTSLITNTKCTLEKTWIVNTADIYAEPPQRQKNFRLKKFLFESFAFKNQKKIKIFMSKFSFSSHARIFGTFGDFEIVKSEFMFHFMTFYAFLSVYVSVISMSFLIFSLYFFSVKPEMHLICLQGMSRDFGWMSLLSEGFTLGGI